MYYSIESPGVSYYKNGTISGGKSTFLNLPSSLIVASYNHQNKGIYLHTNSTNAIVIGQNTVRYSTGTFLALPTVRLCSITEYLYYTISVPSGSYDNAILIVGTEYSTFLNLTVKQSVTVKINDTVSSLTIGRQYSFLVNRLQTVYIGSSSDLTGTRIVTDKPVSVFSGHECGYVPLSRYRDCEYLVEQIPSTIYWGSVYYVAPLQNRNAYTLNMLAAHNFTNVEMYCDNSRQSYSMKAGQVVTMFHQKYCAIHSSKKLLVAQFSPGYYYDWRNADPMMTLVPAKIHYSNKIDLSTISSGFSNYVNIIVLAKYYQPNKIYLTSGGVKKSLQSQSWTAIRFNHAVEAYATQVSVSQGPIKLIHEMKGSLLSAIVYGFAYRTGYGHPGGLKNFPGKYCNLYTTQKCQALKSVAFKSLVEKEEIKGGVTMK